MNLEVGAGRADRAAGRQAAYRPLAQRPGRHGPAALAAAARSTELDAALRRLRAGARRPRRARGHGRPARARPTSSRPSRCCSPITCWPTSRWRSATAAGWPMPRRRANVSPLGPGALAGAGYPLDREATAARARLRRRDRELARRRQRPRLRRRGAGGDRARDGPPQPAGRGDHLVVEPARSGSSGSPTRSRPAAR